MADNKSHVKQTPSKDGIALVVGALFILSLVFAAYNYFNRNNDKTVTVVDDNQNVVTKTKPTGTEPRGHAANVVPGRAVEGAGGLSQG